MTTSSNPGRVQQIVCSHISVTERLLLVHGSVWMAGNLFSLGWRIHIRLFTKYGKIQSVAWRTHLRSKSRFIIALSAADDR